MPEEHNRRLTDQSRSPARSLAERRREPPSRRDRPGREAGREHDDRLPLRAPRRRRAPWSRGATLGLEPGRLRARDASSPGPRRRRRSAAASSPPCASWRETPVVFPLHPRTAALLEATSWTGFVARASGAASRSGTSTSCRWNSAPGVVLTDSGGVRGGVDRPGRPLLHAAPQHRTAGHPDPGHQHLAPRRSPGDPSGGPERRAAGRLHGAALGDGHAGRRIADLIRSRLARREDLEAAWSL